MGTGWRQRGAHHIVWPVQSDGDDGRPHALCFSRITGRSSSPAEHPRQAAVTVVHAVAPRRPGPESPRSTRRAVRWRP
jgi:hypothetical protein